MKPDNIIEVALEAVMFVRKGICSGSVVVLDHPTAGPVVLFFEGGKLVSVEKIVDKGEANTFDEAIQVVYAGISKLC